MKQAVPPDENEIPAGDQARSPAPRAAVMLAREAAHAGQAPKACLSCARIDIGANYAKVSPWRVLVALPFVYLPILAMPFIVLGGALVYLHLRLMGARNLKRLRDFLPAWDSHRYSYKTQIVKRDIHPLARWARTRIFWVFNCTIYCPFSVAALEWTTYLTKAVENWWCPFGHSHKPNYAGSAIDYSFWHVSKDSAQLGAEDRCNPIWNRDAERS